jgi:hypothetical protein
MLLLWAPEARMKVAGGKLRETKRTHRTPITKDPRPGGANDIAVPTVMRPAGARCLRILNRWVRRSLRSPLPTGYVH